MINHSIADGIVNFFYLLHLILHAYKPQEKLCAIIFYDKRERFTSKNIVYILSFIFQVQGELCGFK